MNSLVDLRSDTTTQPSAGMRQAMFEAEVGDDVYGEDPTVLELERTAAEQLGHEAALFVGSGTQSNLIALLTHCQRGDEYIAGNQAHSYLEEGGGGAVLASIQPQPLPNQPDGTIDLEAIRKAIKPDDFHFARTRLLCLENTFFGRPLPLDYIEQAIHLARQHGLAIHLDGARVFNAAVKQCVTPATIGGCFDSVSACLSKGLGAPVGTVLCGSREFIDAARRWRKVVGGGWRQAGILAAAGVYALKHNVDRLVEDHDKARQLAEGLANIDEIEVDQAAVQTNMVFINLPEAAATTLSPFLRDNGIRISVEYNPVRLVTHLDVTDEGIRHVISTFETYFTQHPAN